MSVGASFLVPILYRGLTRALHFDLRPTPPDFHNQTGGMRLTMGFCENSNPNPTDADEYKAHWAMYTFYLNAEVFRVMIQRVPQKHRHFLCSGAIYDC